VTKKLANNTVQIDFPDLELRINNALMNRSYKSFTPFTAPTPSSFNLPLNELLKFRDQQFIEACFYRILGREADQESIDRYLKKLHKGYDPRFIFAVLRYSKEGKRRFEKSDRSLPSLRKYQVLSLPIIGRLVVKILPLYQGMRQRRLF